MPATAEKTELKQRPLTVRQAATQPQSVNQDNRSVNAVIATERMVTVVDLQRMEIIDEVLLADGARMPEQAIMLDSHMRFDTLDVIGSATDFRTADGEIRAELLFGEGPEDSRVEHVWRMVSSGHLRDVSVGYRVDEAVKIEAGETGTVNGRQFTAGARDLRVATAWTLREVSVTPIGADEAAGIREAITETSTATTAETLAHAIRSRMYGNCTDDYPPDTARQELASATGVDVQALLSGDRSVIDASTVRRAAIVLGCESTELIEAAKADGLNLETESHS